MPLGATAAGELPSVKERGQDLAKPIERWCEACHDFLLREREHIVKGHPSRQEQETNRSSLKWLLRLTRLMYAAAADTDFPDRSMAEMLRLTLWKLEQSWRVTYESMPEAEAVRLLKETFSNDADQKLIKQLFPEYS